jgi:glucokinase
VVDQLIQVGREAVSSAGPVVTAGTGVPGVYEPASGRTRFIPNIPGDWAGLPVAGLVAEGLGVPTRLINDARACTLAELRLGAGRGARAILAITVGTGVGGGLALDGRVYQGPDGSAGEFGHQTVLPDGPRCGCGNCGCLEPLANAAAISAACGTATVEEAVAAARAGDERALAGLARVGAFLGIGAANVVVLLAPERIVVGGGVAGAGDLLLEPMRVELRRRVHIANARQTQVLPAELGNWAGAIGAALHGAESPDPVP